MVIAIIICLVCIGLGFYVVISYINRKLVELEKKLAHAIEVNKYDDTKTERSLRDKINADIKKSSKINKETIRQELGILRSETVMMLSKVLEKVDGMNPKV